MPILTPWQKSPGRLDESLPVVLSNLICIAEPLDVLAAELGPVAERITIILPWGTLLRTVAQPEINSLRQIAHLSLPGAAVEIVLSYDPRRDTRTAPLESGILNEEHMIKLPGFYEQAGLRIEAVQRLSQQQLATYETTWAGRLAFGKPREVWRLRAQR